MLGIISKDTTEGFFLNRTLNITASTYWCKHKIMCHDICNFFVNGSEKEKSGKETKQFTCWIEVKRQTQELRKQLYINMFEKLKLRKDHDCW